MPSQVHYPGLAAHPDHAIARRLFAAPPTAARGGGGGGAGAEEEGAADATVAVSEYGYGGMLCFEVSEGERR